MDSVFLCSVIFLHHFSVVICDKVNSHPKMKRKLLHVS